MIDDKLINAINLPLADMDLLKTLAPYLKLGHVMGDFLSQLVDSSIVSLEVESFGVIQDIKPVMLSLLKGLLKDITDSRINYVNVLNVAEERGVSLKFSYNSELVSYSNLVKATVKTDKSSFSIEGCLFE